MDSAKPHSLGSILTRIVCTIVGLLLLYVLSFGPAVFVALKYTRSQPLIQKMYTPLIWTVENTALAKPAMDYVQWWHRLAGDNAAD